MRAVIYARYSSENQREASIEDQVRECQTLIDRQGWTYQHAYTDRAFSGASTLRPGYQLLLQEAREGHFDVVVAEALDRLSRDQEDVAALYKRLRFAGIALFTLAEGEITDLHVGLKGTMNALYLKDLADKTRRGLRGRVEAGRSGGGNSFGYDVVAETKSDGLIVRGARRVNATEAAIVRRIFAAYAAGRSPRRIAYQLNGEAIAAPGGRSWGASTINGNPARGTGILNNELYIGRLVWNRLRYIKDPETGRRVSRLNDPDQWLVREVPELRIVEQELWNRVKARQRAMHRDTRPDATAIRPFWDRRRPRFLLSGLMKCGQCGAGYTKISANLFGCAAARNKGPATCTNRLNVRRDVLEAAIVNGLQHHLMDLELFKVFAEEFTREANRMRGEQRGRQLRLERDLAKIGQRLRRIVDAIGEGIPARTLKDELLSLEARQEELERELSTTAEPQPLLHPNLAELYRKKVAALHEALANEATRDEAFELVRSLVERVVLMPVDGELRIDLYGELAEILSLCGHSKAPGQDRALVEQVKVVAGARNHRQFEISTLI